MAEKEPLSLDPTAITFAPGQSPFHLVPVIDDILRTRYCIPGSILLVEDIVAVPVSKTGRWQAVRLLVGDGELCVQGLLSAAMHRFVETGEVAVGSYIRVDKFDVRIRRIDRDDDGGDPDAHGDPDAEGNARKMVYLVLEDLVTVGWNKSYQALWQAQVGEAAEELAAEHDLDLEETELEYNRGDVDKAQVGAGEPTSARDIESAAVTREDEEDAAMEDAFEAFEALTFPTKTKKTSQAKPDAGLNKEGASSAAHGQPVALPRDWHDTQVPLKLTTLRAIPLLPYAQNWSCNVLAIIASVSPVEPSYLPPYRQRTARLADPSTAKQVHLTVFLEPEDFEPAVGSAVLLVGVKNHRFDGGSLKKYASDAQDGRKWWFQDPWEFGWCDIGGIKRWWDEVQRSLA